MKPLNLTTFNVTYKVIFKKNCLNGINMCCPHFLLNNYKSELSESGCKIIDDDTISCTKTMSFGRSSSTLVSFTFAACDSRVGLYPNY